MPEKEKAEDRKRGRKDWKDGGDVPFNRPLAGKEERP